MSPNGMRVWEDELAASRDEAFIGRQSEQAAFLQWMKGRSVGVLCVSGRPGLGKTTLVNRLAELAREHDWDLTRVVGGPWVEPSFFLRRVEHLRSDPAVLFVDGFDRLQHLELWFRDQFLPELPQTVRVVLTQRDPLDSSWMSDAAYRKATSSLRLGAFSVAESCSLLQKFGIEGDHAEQLHLAYSGHPGNLVRHALSQEERRHQSDPPSDTDGDSFLGELRSHGPEWARFLRRSFERTVQQLEIAANDEARDVSLNKVAPLVSLDAYGTYPLVSHIRPTPPKPDEVPDLIARIGEQLGKPAARLAELWLEESWEGAVVGRDPSGKLAWFAQFENPRKVTDRIVDRDPALTVVLPWLDGLELGDDSACLCRFFCPLEGRFVVDNAATASLMTEMQRRLLLSQHSVPISVQPAWVLDELSTWGQHPTVGSFESEGAEWIVCGYDLRERSPFEIIRRRMGPSGSLSVPERDDFDSAVRLALRDFYRGDRLAKNPLAEWLGLSGTTPTRQTALRRHIERAVARLGPHGGDARHAHLITATYLEGGAKQRAVAAELGMGFSTYRHHLRIAIQRLSLILWEHTFDLHAPWAAADPGQNQASEQRQNGAPR